MISKIHDWCLGIWEDERDFLIWSTLTLDEVSKKLPKIEREIISLDQSSHPFTKRCTSMSTLWILYTYLKKKPSKQELLEFNNFCISEYSRWTDRWNYTATGVKIAVRFVNERYKRSFMYFRWTNQQDEVLALLKRWYGAVNTYKWNFKYTIDKRDDGMVNWIEFWKTTFWHAVAKWEEWFNDTYPRRVYNRYNVEHIKELTDNGYHFRNVYVVVDGDYIGKDKQTLKNEKMKEMSIKANSLMRNYIDKNMGKTSLNKEAQNKLHEANNAIRNLDL